MEHRLESLKAAADAAEQALDTACRPHYADGRWGAYRDSEYGRKQPKAVRAALDEYHATLMAYYAARDGAKGFLGGKGL